MEEREPRLKRIAVNLSESELTEAKRIAEGLGEPVAEIVRTAYLEKRDDLKAQARRRMEILGGEL